ncbi:MAG: hypothetical protein KY459_10700 [Acidobacteria bacterium]|nr:hypothetical protein [Acidobacteriota bacterium]
MTYHREGEAPAEPHRHDLARPGKENAVRKSKKKRRGKARGVGRVKRSFLSLFTLHSSLFKK